MFTGIVEELGEVVAQEDLGDATRMTIRGPIVTSDAGHGDSIAVNGVCLTVVDVLADGQFSADVMAETLNRSSLRALSQHWEIVRIGLPREISRYVVEKGSITVDGISLTVSALADEDGTGWFEVSLIPTTLALTTLGRAAVGTPVNLEVDVIAKYVERLLGERRS